MIRNVFPVIFFVLSAAACGTVNEVQETADVSDTPVIRIDHTVSPIVFCNYGQPDASAQIILNQPNKILSSGNVAYNTSGCKSYVTDFTVASGSGRFSLMGSFANHINDKQTCEQSKLSVTIIKKTRPLVGDWSNWTTVKATTITGRWLVYQGPVVKFDCTLNFEASSDIFSLPAGTLVDQYRVLTLPTTNGKAQPAKAAWFRR